MSFTNEENREYYLLKTYKDISLLTRGILLRSNFDSIEKIQKNEWLVHFSEDELEKSKRMTIGMIQSDIIAKIMMYIEDFAIISEGLLRETDYYVLLDQKINPITQKEEDVGKIIQHFFEKMHSLTVEELKKILSYGDPEDYTENKHEIILLQKGLSKELEEFKRVVSLISDFGKEHHPYFRRYKHAGFPCYLGMPLVDSLPDYTKSFDFISLVCINEDLFNEPKIIPYSEKVNESYKIIIHGLQQILQDVLKNRIAFLQRGKKLPSIPWRTLLFFSNEEMTILENILQKYDKNNPPIKTTVQANYQVKNSESWYANLDEFLNECKKTFETDKDFAKKTNYRYLDEKDKEFMKN